MALALNYVVLKPGDTASSSVLIKPSGVFYSPDTIVLADELNGNEMFPAAAHVPTTTALSKGTTVGYMGDGEYELGTMATIAALELKAQNPASHDEYTRAHEPILRELGNLPPVDMSVTALLACCLAHSSLSFEEKVDWLIYLVLDYTFWAANQSVLSAAEGNQNLSVLDFMTKVARQTEYRLPNKREMLIQKAESSAELNQQYPSVSQALAYFLN